MNVLVDPNTGRIMPLEDTGAFRGRLELSIREPSSGMLAIYIDPGPKEQ